MKHIIQEVNHIVSKWVFLLFEWILVRVLWSRLGVDQSQSYASYGPYEHVDTSWIGTDNFFLSVTVSYCQVLWSAYAILEIGILGRSLSIQVENSDELSVVTEEFPEQQRYTVFGNNIRLHKNFGLPHAGFRSQLSPNSKPYEELF